MASMRRVIVYGGCGALGRTCVDTFKSHNWWVCSVDLTANPSADANVTIDSGTSGDWRQQAKHVGQAVAQALGRYKVQAILCVAGGFGMSDAAAPDFIDVCDAMWKQSVWSSCVAGQLAASHLCDNGLLQLTGAKPALGPTPALIGYGMAKAAVHQLTSSLAAPKSGLPSGCVVVCVAPITLDTPANRNAMPKADFSKWTPLNHFADYLYKWSCGEERPSSGAKLVMATNDGKTHLEAAGN